MMTIERPVLRPADVLRVGASGPRARVMRTVLSALGVSIGIAALALILYSVLTPRFRDRPPDVEVTAAELDELE